MKYEDFEKFIKEKCMYDTIYDDSEGRQILIIQMLDAYGMVDKALRARLAQPEPAECDGGQCGIGGYCKECPKTKPEERLFTEAQALDIAQKLFDSAALNAVPIGWVRKKEWVGLTDDEIEGITARVLTTLTKDVWPIALSRAIEAKLKEKNT